jgi:RNA polymerase sigma-70 factor (ECF subfamily)
MNSFTRTPRDSPPLPHVVSALDSGSWEDIVQSVMIKAARNLASYRGDGALFTWLTQICRHELADVHRKAARRPVLLSLEEMTARPLVAFLRMPTHREPVAQLAAGSEGREVIEILGSLPEHYARALEATYGDGLSVRDIARQLGLTVVATQSAPARAREAFRERWQAGPHRSISQESPL